MIGLLPVIANVVVYGLFTVLATVLESGILAMVGMLVCMGIGVWMLINTLRALDEMRNAAGNPAFPRWPMFIPIYQIIYFISMVPKEMQKAKQMRGVQAMTRNVVLYLFFPLFALQSDLNDIAAAP